MDNLPHELLQQICMFLHYHDIISYCKVNTISNLLRQDNTFWLEKLDYDMWDKTIHKPSHYVTRYGPYNERGIITYRRWMLRMFRSDIYYYIQKSYNDLLFWTLDTKSIDVHECALSAAEFNNIPILKELEGRNILDLNPKNNSIAFIALFAGHIDVLDWLNDRGCIPNMEDIARLKPHYLLPILKWLHTKDMLENFDPNICPRNIDLNIWIFLEHLGHHPETHHANIHAEIGDLIALKWFESKGILPDHQGADSAASNGNLHILKWLQTKEIYATTAIKAIINGHTNTVQWLKEYGIVPTF